MPQLSELSDKEILIKTKSTVKNERDALLQVLLHLMEVDRRKLFSDEGYKSLFDYVNIELNYSTGEAARRVQAMRLLRDFPEIGDKISDGTLSLTNLSQAYVFFREMKDYTKKQNDGKSESRTEEKNFKQCILSALENMPSREAEKYLISLRPSTLPPKEKYRKIATAGGTQYLEIKLYLNEELQQKLEEVRSLLGPKKSSLSLTDLISEMATLSAASLKKKKPEHQAPQDLTPKLTPAPEQTSTPKNNIKRYIPKEIRYLVWQRDEGKCVQCKSKMNLQIDHIIPFAQGGTHELKNLRLLCFNCNQRHAIKTFGLIKMEQSKSIFI